MVAKAQVKHVRMSAQKARLVLDLVRGKNAGNALAILANTHRRAAVVVGKLVRSALANAKQSGLESDTLYISKIFADEGATWKRFRAATFGRGMRILKRTCHISVELDRSPELVRRQLRAATAPSATGEKKQKS